MGDLPVADRPRVAVVGGGIAGLGAAWELTGGAAGPGPGTPSVVVLEADRRCGGKLATAEFSGEPVDVGPDGFLGRRPEAEALCRELGLGARLVPVGASGAAVWARGRPRPLPDGLALGIPTRVLPVAGSGILSPSGTARLALDLVAPRPDTRGPLGDRAIGPLLVHKLGHQVVERLVDPMLGGIHAGGLGDASAAALLPDLLTAAQGRSSLMRALRNDARARDHESHHRRRETRPTPLSWLPWRTGVRHVEGTDEVDAGSDGRQPSEEAAGNAGPPLFWALEGGLESLATALVAQLGSRGVVVRTSSPVSALERRGGRWVLRSATGGDDAEEFDAVILALPAGPAAELLVPHDTDASGMLRATDYASVAVVTLSYADDDVPDDLYGTGLLVPRETVLPRGATAVADADARAPRRRRETCLVTACTYLSCKWPHLARPGERLLRASVGRYGDERFAELCDDDLVDRVTLELGALLGTTGAPHAALVTRWPEALPQYRVHHLLRVGAVESAVKRLGGLAVAGAAYHGVGIPACVASGRRAARDVLAQLEGVGQRAPA